MEGKKFHKSPTLNTCKSFKITGHNTMDMPHKPHRSYMSSNLILQKYTTQINRKLLCVLTNCTKILNFSCPGQCNAQTNRNVLVFC